MDLSSFKEIDIRFNRPSPRKELSNLYPRRFVFDGVSCNSIEGVLQSLKLPSHMVISCCKKFGFDAMYYGREFTRNDGKLFWKNQEIDRYDFAFYHEWLHQLYRAAFTQDDFSRNFLLSTKNIKLTHKVGKASVHQTILTEKEFCDTLMNVRSELRVEQQNEITFG